MSFDLKDKIVLVKSENRIGVVVGEATLGSRYVYYYKVYFNVDDPKYFRSRELVGYKNNQRVHLGGTYDEDDLVVINENNLEIYQSLFS